VKVGIVASCLLSLVFNTELQAHNRYKLINCHPTITH
jgi:hypothetical protein